ncbi:MAG: two-component system, cell cycle sensor histidine kinase and response regulator CckA, partial [Solirubrobacteraceae bacterium]|nr:two-component system, cell cycle sensor histidine kinase and response regulator CckA [Solirubrobacteraceae bacterium]
MSSVPDQEFRFRSLVDRLGVAIWEATPGALAGEATFTYMSGGAQSLLGFPPERWLEDPRFWIENVHPDDRPRIAAEVAAAVVEQRGADLEYRCFDSEGRERWVRNILQ